MKARGGMATSGRSHAAISHAADWFREHNFGGRLSLRDSQDAVALFESLDDCVVPCGGSYVGLDYVVGKPPPGAEADTFFDADANAIVIRLGETAYNGLHEGQARAIFSLAHEIGHAVMHSALLARICHLPHDAPSLRREGRSHAIFENTEWQSDSFAASLIAPRHELYRLSQEVRLSPSIIQRNFPLSRVAAEARLRVYSDFEEGAM